MNYGFREIIRLSSFAVATMIFLTTTATAQPVKRCVIASANSGAYSFSTAAITGCKINTSNSQTSYNFKGKERERSYIGSAPFAQRHINIPKKLLRQIKKFRVNPNPANFDILNFLQEAARAEQGIVLNRTRKGKRALTIVFITDGVYRSIDFKGTNINDEPAGFLTTAAGG